jgi:hypothetical protein
MTEEKKQPEQEHNAGIDMLPEIEPETCQGTTTDELTHTMLGRDGRIQRLHSG